jgi:hypothetical protein
MGLTTWCTLIGPLNRAPISSRRVTRHTIVSERRATTRMQLTTKVCWPHGSLISVGSVFDHGGADTDSDSRAPILSSARGVAGATCELCNSNIKSKTSLIVFSVLLVIRHERIIMSGSEYTVYAHACMQQAKAPDHTVIQIIIISTGT